MIDVSEHVYEDDPHEGHPDCRTRLPDVSYFFLGNGRILAAVQICPGGQGTPIGLLIMNPDRFGRKRDALTFDTDSGLEQTTVRVIREGRAEPMCPPGPEGEWCRNSEIPKVIVRWVTDDVGVEEWFYCPDLEQPLLLREVRVTNCSSHSLNLSLRTGIRRRSIDDAFGLKARQERHSVIKYTFLAEENRVILENVADAGVLPSSSSYWKNTASVSFGHELLDHLYRAAAYQLPAVVSESGKCDASIWQYNREWVRDHAMMSIGLTLAGNHMKAKKLLDRLLKAFITEDGQPFDSSEKRNPEEVELDQNGELLYAIDHYVRWTRDSDFISTHWDTIKAVADYPLQNVFRHDPSGLLINAREYWERHSAHGLQMGIELAHQLFVSIGLDSAARLARLTGRKTEADQWEREAGRLKRAMLHDTRYGLVQDRRLIKRRSQDGSVQETIAPLPECGLPDDVPLAGPQEHRLNPDASTALPIALGFLPADHPAAKATLADLETLWDQAWEGGGYGRYHVSSEPDSPGAWPFPSLFIARACSESGDSSGVWRVLRWLNSVSGAKAGSWFEYYGDRQSPPFPQVGIPPWTWAEILILLIDHIIGLRPEYDAIRIRPRLLPGLKEINGSFPIQGRRWTIHILADSDDRHLGFDAGSRFVESGRKEARVSYTDSDCWIEARLQQNA